MQHEIYYSIVNLSTYKFSEKQWKQLIPQNWPNNNNDDDNKNKI